MAWDGKPAGIVTLLSDFGTTDTYVGQMKGAILRRAANVVVVDLTHAVRPQAVEQGAFLLESALPAFPEGAVHLAVVDPGVGSSRKPLAIRYPGGWLVGPDNGLLSAALPETARPVSAPGPCPLLGPLSAVAIEPAALGAGNLSATFHGRDLFAPAAAHLAAGGALGDLGTPVATMIGLPPFRAERLAGGRLRGRVVHIDHFGNLLTSIRAADLSGPNVAFHHARHHVQGLRVTYADAPPDELIALVGSGGLVEFAVRDGNAAERTDIRLGDEVTAEPLRPA